MLRKIESFGDLDGRKLMDVYAEGNEENAEYFHPDEPDRVTITSGTGPTRGLWFDVRL